MGPNPILVNTLTGPGASANTTAVNIDAAGHLYLTAANFQNVSVYNSDDSYYSPPTYNGLGYNVSGIAIDLNNYIYISGSGSIHSYAPLPSFGIQGTYGSGMNGLKYDPYNNLLYSARGNANVYIYQSNGGMPNLLNQSYIPASFAMNTGSSIDMVFNPVNSLIYATNGTRIEVHNPASSYFYTGTAYGDVWASFAAPFGIDVEPISGYLYLADITWGDLHTFSPNGANHTVFSDSQGDCEFVRLNNKCGKLYMSNYNSNIVSVYFDPFAWTSPGTSYLASLPLNQPLTLNAGYNLTITTNTLGTVPGGVTNGRVVTNVNGTSTGNICGLLYLNSGSTLTLAGGTLTPDINQGIVMNTGTLIDQFNSTLNFPMTIIAPSTITSNGGNTLKLAGTTTINNTSLTLNGAGITKITGNITGTGTLNVNGNINFANTVMFGGSINLSSGTPSLTANQIWGSIQGSAPLTMNNYMITLGADNTNQTYSGSLTGTGVIYKNGTGIQTFTGNLSGFTGMIVVTHGEVIINSSTPFGGKIINESTINTKNNTVINGDFVSSGTFIVG
jgi:hypothetical protein